MEADTCVYLLRDPRDSVARYVGITKYPKKRLYHHWRDRTSLCNYYSAPGNKARGEWFLDMERNRVMPVMDILFTGLTRKQALRVESHILKATVGADPGRMKQQLIETSDPLRAVREAWEKANPIEKKRICHFVTVSIKDYAKST